MGKLKLENIKYKVSGKTQSYLEPVDEFSEVFLHHLIKINFTQFTLKYKDPIKLIKRMSKLHNVEIEIDGKLVE